MAQQTLLQGCDDWLSALNHTTQYLNKCYRVGYVNGIHGTIQRGEGGHRYYHFEKDILEEYQRRMRRLERGEGEEEDGDKHTQQLAELVKKKKKERGHSEGPRASTLSPQPPSGHQKRRHMPGSTSLIELQNEEELTEEQKRQREGRKRKKEEEEARMERERSLKWELEKKRRAEIQRRMDEKNASKQDVAREKQLAREKLDAELREMEDSGQ